MSEKIFDNILVAKTMPFSMFIDCNFVNIYSPQHQNQCLFLPIGIVQYLYRGHRPTFDPAAKIVFSSQKSIPGNNMNFSNFS